MTRLTGNTRRIAARSTTTSLALALVLVGIVPSSAQMLYAPESLQRDFRVEWQPTQNRRGAGIEGYVYNTSNRTAQRVSLRIERVELPMTDRVYFSASVPTAARYHVQVLSFDWSCQGGGGGGM